MARYTGPIKDRQKNFGEPNPKGNSKALQERITLRDNTGKR